MSETMHVVNPETGRRIQVGGVTFNHLIFTSYDFINEELVRRATAPPPTPRQYFLNTQTNRLIQASSRRYHKMIRTGWDIIEDYYLIPPGEPVAETIAMVQDLGNEIARRRRIVDANRPPTYEEIMDRHRVRLTDLNVSLCRECLFQSRWKVNTVKTVLPNKQIT